MGNCIGRKIGGIFKKLTLYLATLFEIFLQNHFNRTRNDSFYLLNKEDNPAPQIGSEEVLPVDYCSQFFSLC
jgi:hypothetical protein